jgi:hypothetical protein
VDVEVNIDLNVHKEVSYTNADGINLNYSIDNTLLSVGDTLIVTLNSDNEVKPWVKIAANDTEVL